MSHIARTDKDEFQPSSNQDRWRLTPDAITSLRKAANARGRGLVAAGVVTPPEAFVEYHSQHRRVRRARRFC